MEIGSYLLLFVLQMVWPRLHSTIIPNHPFMIDCWKMQSKNKQKFYTKKQLIFLQKCKKKIKLSHFTNQLFSCFIINCVISGKANAASQSSNSTHFLLNSYFPSEWKGTNVFAI